MAYALTKHEENLVVELYLSTNADVDKISLQLLELSKEYYIARKKASMREIGEKFEVHWNTIGCILKRHGVRVNRCMARVVITKK